MCVSGCRDARLSAARRNEEHRRSSKSRWPAGERNRSGGLLQHPHLSHFQSSPLLMACASVELNGAYVPTFFWQPSHSVYSFIIHLKICKCHILCTPSPLSPSHSTSNKSIRFASWLCHPSWHQSPYFFHPLLSAPTLIPLSLIQNVAFVIG